MVDVTVRRSLLIGLALATVLAAGGCARYEDGIGIGKIANIPVQYYRGLADGDCELARAKLSEDLAADFRCQEEIDRWPALDSAQIAYRAKWTTRVANDQARVRATIRTVPGSSAEGTPCGVPGEARVDHHLVREADGGLSASASLCMAEVALGLTLGPSTARLDISAAASGKSKEMGARTVTGGQAQSAVASRCDRMGTPLERSRSTSRTRVREEAARAVHADMFIPMAPPTWRDCSLAWTHDHQ